MPYPSIYLHLNVCLCLSRNQIGGTLTTTIYGARNSTCSPESVEGQEEYRLLSTTLTVGTCERARGERSKAVAQLRKRAERGGGERASGAEQKSCVMSGVVRKRIKFSAIVTPATVGGGREEGTSPTTHRKEVLSCRSVDIGQSRVGLQKLIPGTVLLRNNDVKKNSTKILSPWCFKLAFCLLSGV